MTSAVFTTFQPIIPVSWHPNPRPPKPEATRANEERAGEEGQAAGLWGGEARLRVSQERHSGSGVWRGAGGGGRAPGGRCRRRRHSVAMERPRAAADCVSRRPHGLGLLLFLVLQLLPRAAFCQDRLDAPPPPAAPLSRWAGPIGVSWGLRAAGPGGPFLRGRWRRSAPGEDEDCGRVPDFVARLVNNTHQHVFDDLSGSVSLSWVGDSTGIILVLTTFHVPLVIMTFGQSKLYRSEDYGKNFKDITNLINNTFIRTEFGMAIGPENSGKVILTAEVSGGSHGGRIFRSSDFAKNFIQTNLPFHPLTQMMYSPQNSDYLLALSTENGLWVSKNFGGKWEEIHKAVCLAKWGSGNTIFFTTYVNGSCTDLGALELWRTSDLGKSFKTIGVKIYSFGLGGRFLFASVMANKDTTRRIHVSTDQGDTWSMAQLPSVGQEQFYSILAANDDMVFMHVDEPGDTGFGTIFTSDDRGIVYSKSLDRHLYTTTGGETDFTNVTSLRGVYITSVLSEDNSIQTMITFDQGGRWKHLRKPENSECDATAKNKNECSLHIHASYSISQKLNVPMAPLSEPNAVGIVIAHGSVGDAISVMVPDVYISDDGGYSWAKMLEGPHYYTILDSGGIIVAIEHSNRPINVIKFSTDEGQCWQTYTFTKEPIYFTGLASEPGARSMNVSIWGFTESFLTRQWVSYTIDFKDILERNCEEKDYTIWLAHSTDPGDFGDGCILGYKEQFLRLHKSSICQNGRDYVVTKQPSVCPCSLEDFLCDFGYFRPENDSKCVEQPELKGHDLEFCLYGKEEHLTTNGYRKIPGDKCQGGVNPVREVKDLKKKCTSNFLNPEMQKSKSNSVPIILATVGLMLITIVAGVLIVKKYVCGGRFLVHRYSVLQQHAEANGVDGVDALDTASRTNKSGYHDDSDEDLLE
ncbi:sortilin isoform X3 [Phyllostomus hastatus]|uniref:sortilin isoform X3 n=1 Tax=Phyllostomus hastatus TaxID=9423 RepID=UPI001E684A1F|nr:sortilin isoform X3 [Phyllostomus hastatus]